MRAKKNFVTISQKIITKVVMNGRYRVIRLPATFRGQSVEVFHLQKRKGIQSTGIETGGASMISLGENDMFSVGDIVTASFHDNSNDYKKILK